LRWGLNVLCQCCIIILFFFASLFITVLLKYLFSPLYVDFFMIMLSQLVPADGTPGSGRLPLNKINKKIKTS